MKTSVERIDETTVKLSVTVEAERVNEAFAEAARHMAAEVKVPGFRPGRVPKKILERRIGTAAIAEHALQDSLPAFYSEAVQAEELDVVGPPQFDVGTFQEGKEGTFTAEVAVRPEFEVPEYEGREIEHPEWEVTDEEVSQQLDALRERFAELETVQRPAQVGDHARITVTGTKGGEPDPDASGEDLLYEIRDPEQSDAELDRQLVGSEAGAILKFRDKLGADYGDRAGEELDFTVIVKEVKAKKLPDLDDDFALTASEFDTIEQLTEAVRTGLARQKRAIARQELRSRVVQEIAKDIDIPLPKVMVDEEVRFRLNRIANDAQRMGIDFAQYVQASGLDIEELQNTLREQAEETVKAQLVVDAIGAKAGIEVTNEDLAGEVTQQALRMGLPPEEVAKMMDTRERLQALVSDAFRRKTIDHLIASVDILSPPPEDDTDLDPVMDDEPVAPSTAGESDAVPTAEGPDDETAADETAAEDEEEGEQDD